MKINHKVIKELNPCDNRYENFKKHYPEFDSDLKEFLYLENISHSDKVWVFTRLATKEQNIKWSIMCAESVLHVFEEKYPTDLRPRAAIEAAETYILNPTEENEDAANAAANAANAAANAANAAYAAAYAAKAAAYAANAAYAAAYAAKAAAYAAAAANAANAAYAAAYAAKAAANAANAAYAAAYAAKAAAYAANAAYAAAYAAANVANAAEKQQEQLNLMFMIEAIK